MSTNLDWKSLEGLEEATPFAPSHTRSFAEKLTPAEKEPWESLEGLTTDEKEETPSLLNKAWEGYKENVYKAPLRATGRNIATLTAAPFKGIGHALQSFSKLGAESQEGDMIRGKGTKMVKDFGSFLSNYGERNEAFMKGEVEKYLGKSYSTLEEGLTKASERANNIVGQMPVPGLIAPAIVGGFLGQAGEDAGLDEDAQSMLEMTGLFSQPFAQSMEAIFKKGGLGSKLLNFIKGNPKDAGKLTGLGKTQLEAFNALKDSEKASYLENLAKKELQLRSGIATEEVGAKALEGQQTGTGRSLQDRVSVGGEDLEVTPQDTGVRPATTVEGNLENTLDSVHVNEMGNKRVAGEALKNTIIESDNLAYQHVNDLYTKARELNEGINGPHIKLTHQLETRLDNLKRIPRPSSVQKNLINALEDIIGELAEVTEGQIVGYKDVNNQVLVDQIQSLRQTVDFDFEHGSPKGIFKPTISDIQESVYAAAEGEAAEALQEANRSYREWTTNYNNDYVNPYRDRSNRSFEKLLDKNLDPDHFNVINELVGDTPQGNEILRRSQREMVADKLDKYIKKPEIIRTRGFRKAMTELESVLSPQQLELVQAEMESQVPQRLRQQGTGREIPTRAKATKELETFTKESKATAKYMDKTPAEIRKLSNTPEGIQQLKKDLSGTQKKKDIFKKLAKEKIESMKKGGKIRAKPTGKEIFDVFNKEDNYALLEALTSPEEAIEALDAAEKLASKKFTKENVAKYVKLGGKYKLIHMLLF